MEQKNNSMSIVSLVLGIVGVAVAWFGWSAILSVGLGIASIVLGVKGRKQCENTGMATAGLVLCIIGLILNGIISVVLGGIMVLCVACAACAVATGAGISALS